LFSRFFPKARIVPPCHNTALAVQARLEQPNQTGTYPAR
jgi:hypothetical protein